MVILDCGVPNCTYQTSDASDAIAIALLTNHNLAHQITTTNDANAAARPRGPKLERPRIDMGVDGETWNTFQRRWDNFRRGSGIDDQSASLQLFQCAAISLGDALLKADPTVTSRPIADVIAAMKALAIIPVSRGVKRAELVAMLQSPDEAFHAFSARVRGKAETCAFTVAAECPCGLNNIVDYTDETIRDVLLAGIADLDIRREALGVEGLQLRTVNDVIGFVEGREMARNALPSTMNSAISSFRRATSQKQVGVHESTAAMHSPSATERAKCAPCPDCRKNFCLFSETSRGWNKYAHERCKECYMALRKRRFDGKRSSAQPASANSVQIEEGPFSQITAVTIRRRRNQLRVSSKPRSPHVFVLQHHIFSKGEWRRARFSKHPTVQLCLSIDRKAPYAHGKRSQQIIANVKGVTDSGAQSNVWSLDQFLASGFSHNDLHPVSLSLQAANKTRISIEGAFFGIIEGRDHRFP